MSKKEIKTVVADDDKLFQSILNEMILKANERSNDFELKVLKCFSNTRRLKDFLWEKNEIDLLFLDVDFQGGESGIDALEQIRRYAPNLTIILLTNDNSDDIKYAQEKYNVKHLKKKGLESDDIYHDIINGILSKIYK